MKSPLLDKNRSRESQYEQAIRPDFGRTGGRISDVTVLEGVLEGTEDHIFAVKFSESCDLGMLTDYSLSLRISQA